MAKMKGQTNYPSDKGDRGIPKCSKPKMSEKTSGPIVWSGQGGNKGIPGKASGGKNSSWAATHD